MTIYNWLCLLGIPSLLVGLIGWMINKIRQNAAETKALRLGVQALLRDRLTQAYTYFSGKGYASLSDRENFDNMYKQYHQLGENGVMDDVYNKFFDLPFDPPSDEGEMQ